MFSQRELIFLFLVTFPLSSFIERFTGTVNLPLTSCGSLSLGLTFLPSHSLCSPPLLLSAPLPSPLNISSCLSFLSLSHPHAHVQNTYIPFEDLSTSQLCFLSLSHTHAYVQNTHIPFENLSTSQLWPPWCHPKYPTVSSLEPGYYPASLQMPLSHLRRYSWQLWYFLMPSEQSKIPTYFPFQSRNQASILQAFRCDFYLFSCSVTFMLTLPSVSGGTGISEAFRSFILQKLMIRNCSLIVQHLQENYVWETSTCWWYCG